jgi:AcrR family transcriptional regulator
VNTKEKICLNASKMFLEQGFDNTPMSQIAKELGLSKAGLYHHYSSKESLLFDVIDYMNMSIFVPIYKEANKILDPEKRLTYFLQRFTEIMTTDASSRIAVHEARKLKPHHFKKVKQSWRMTYDLIKNAISEMQASGKAKKINNGFAAFAAIGMCSWTFYWFDYSKKESWKELSETFIEVFMKGITN